MLLFVSCVGLAGVASGQTVRTWTSNSDQRWSRNANWSGSNAPNASNEIAEFGTGSQLNPQLNANNYTVRGISFSTGAGSYVVGDDNGSRTLKIGNGSGGFIENLSGNDQLISIATLQFQSSATISTSGTGALAISSTLTGNNPNLTFDATSDITVSGNITTSGGTLTKQGTGNLNLSGANSYTGQTTLSAGAIVLQAANVFADSGQISIFSGATLRLNDLTDIIGGVTGSGAIDFGSAGTGQLTLGAGTSTFAGSFLGSGSLVIGAGATLALGADFSNSSLNIILDGGSLNLSGHSLSIGSLNVSGNSLIDFSASSNSVLQTNSLGFANTGLLLTVQNWADAADYFYSQTGYAQGSAPLDQVQFQGWTTSDTKWQSYDNQITPVPEPGAYGAVFLAAGLAIVGIRRRRQREGVQPDGWKQQ
ncbi:MAG: autotransporter-associated beta strand repeat-containing protein [Lacunisphaera sp.]|nr:autotransporter-associated beta strand repeat-containing protein [Lacunisphaera sp.]